MQILLLLTIIFYLLFLLIQVDKKEKRSKTLIHNGVELYGSKVILLRNWVQRRVGLLNTISLASGEGLMFKSSSPVHTIGMEFSIDVIFISKGGKVLDFVQNVGPGVKKINPPRGTKFMFEFSQGEVKRRGFRVGDILEVM